MSFKDHLFRDIETNALSNLCNLQKKSIQKLMKGIAVFKCVFHVFPQQIICTFSRLEVGLLGRL